MLHHQRKLISHRYTKLTSTQLKFPSTVLPADIYSPPIWAQIRKPGNLVRLHIQQPRTRRVGKVVLASSRVSARRLITRRRRRAGPPPRQRPWVSFSRKTERNFLVSASPRRPATASSRLSSTACQRVSVPPPPTRLRSPDDRRSDAEMRLASGANRSLSEKESLTIFSREDVSGRLRRDTGLGVDCPS